MHALDIILNFFREGGIFLYPIALVWVVGLVIALERFGFIMKAGAGNRRIWAQVQPLLELGQVPRSPAGGRELGNGARAHHALRHHAHTDRAPPR